MERYKFPFSPVESLEMPYWFYLPHHVWRLWYFEANLIPYVLHFFAVGARSPDSSIQLFVETMRKKVICAELTDRVCTRTCHSQDSNVGCTGDARSTKPCMTHTRCSAGCRTYWACWKQLWCDKIILTVSQRFSRLFHPLHFSRGKRRQHLVVGRLPEVCCWFDPPTCTHLTWRSAQFCAYKTWVERRASRVSVEDV